MIKKLFAFLTVLCLFLGCSKTDVQIPSYIEIDNYFTKVAKDSSQGTNNQKFTDVLVYANGTTYGTYPLGSKIPVLTSGPTSFIIRGVIRVNGVDILRSDYEVMKGCDTLVTVNPGKVTRVIPTFEYFTSAKFRWMDDFEPNTQTYGGVESSYGQHPTLTANTYTPGFGGYGTCLALRPTSDSTASVQTKATIALPAGGIGVYMEINYLSNTTIHILINGQDGGSIKPSSSWNKMYLTLTEQVSSLQAGTYTIAFQAYYDPTVGANLALIDNIKIVTVQ
jgi:hypothetical protein